METYLAGNTFAARATSSFPLSIGTGLAFESLFSATQAPYDPNRVIPEAVDVTAYRSCWINLSTLFRNLVSSVTKEAFMGTHASELAVVLEEEIDVIQGLFSNEGKDQCKPEFYFGTYAQLLKRNTPGLSFREATTPGQHFYNDRLTETIDLLNDRSDTYRKFDDAVRPFNREKAIILTHFPYDLTAFDQFDRLDLLESNTGVLKPKSRWNTKYSPMSGQSFNHLPFSKKLLLVFGDKVLLKPGPTPLRKQVLETSLARGWTPATTEAKVKFDLDLDIRDPYMAAVWHGL